MPTSERGRRIRNKALALSAWGIPTRDELAAVLDGDRIDTMRQIAGGAVYYGLGACSERSHYVDPKPRRARDVDDDSRSEPRVIARVVLPVYRGAAASPTSAGAYRRIDPTQEALATYWPPGSTVTGYVLAVTLEGVPVYVALYGWF